MISESPFAALFGAVPADGSDVDLVKQARAVVRAGYALVVCKPGTKVPMCTLNSVETKKADEAAQEQARAEGRPRWDRVRHACGLKHAITTEKDSDRVLKRLIRDHGRVNLGIELKASRIVVVDVDTTVEDEAFKQSWFAATGSRLPFSMSVSSPGVHADEEWKHKDGGHYWFSLPDGLELPAIDGAMKMPGGWTVMWADRQVLVPPSVRPEGSYQLVGDVHPIPEWLLRSVLVYMTERKQRAQRKMAESLERSARGDAAASIDVWSAEVPWDDLLEPDGWTNTGKPSVCGCLEWMAPGNHASSKSATAHEPGCAEPGYDDALGHLPLHVWTDNPPDFLATPAAHAFSQSGKTFSKIQYVALRDHDGDVRAACRAVDIPVEGGRPVLTPLQVQRMITPTGESADPSPAVSATSGQGSTALTPLTVPTAADIAPVALTPEELADQANEEKIRDRLAWKRIEDEADRRLRQLRYPFLTRVAEREFKPMADVLAAASARKAEFLVEGWLRAGSYGALGAEYKAGKTWLMMDLALSVATGNPFLGIVPVKQGRVAIMHNEGDEQEFSDRLHAIARHKRVVLTDEVLDRLSVQLGATKLDDPGQVDKLHRQLSAFKPDLVQIDPWYLSAGEADGKVISKMGDVLGNIQGVTDDLGAALLIACHWNQTGQGSGVARWSGAGLAEWGRSLINVALAKYTPARKFAEDKTGKTTAELTVDLSGAVSGHYALTRDVWRTDAHDLGSDLHYRLAAAEVDEERRGEKAVDVTRSDARRLLDAFGAWPEGYVKGKAIETARGVAKKPTGSTYKKWTLAFDELVHGGLIEEVATTLATNADGNIKNAPVAKYAITPEGRAQLDGRAELKDVTMFVKPSEA